MEHDATSLGWYLYDALVPVAAAAVVWLSARVSWFVKAQTKNELVRGMLQRLNLSVFDAVMAVNQQMGELIERARRPESDGGKKLTRSEAESLKKMAIAHVQSYWGEKGLLELAKVLGIAGFFEAKDSILGKVYALISNKVEATIGEIKKKL